MVDILDTNGINNRVSEILGTSEEVIVVISPYIKLSDTTLDQLRNAVLDDVELFVIYGKRRLDEYLMHQLANLDGCSLGYIQDLHAKVVLDEKGAVLSSMNLYQYSQINNTELGVYIDAEGDPEEYADLMRKVIRISAYSDTVFGPWDMDRLNDLIIRAAHRAKEEQGRKG